MPYADLREFLKAVDELGELVRVKPEVDGNEIFTILWELNNREGPVALFENVKGHKTPIVNNIFGTLDRYAMACGFPRGKTFKEYQDLFTKTLDQKNWRKPRIVESGPCQEVVLKGDDVDLTKLPILKWHPGDGGPYVTMPIVVTKDSHFGVNATIHRMMVFDKNTTGMMCNAFQDQGIYLQRAIDAGKPSIECAVAIGADPAIYEAAVTKIPLNANEFEFAAALRGGEPVDMVKCQTVDLEVPAGAEFVLEGEISTTERRREGPYGEWMGYWEEQMELPVFKIKCITHRKDPIFQMTTEGHQHGEGEIVRIVNQAATFARSCVGRITGFHDASLPPTGRGYTAVISIKKRYPEWGKQAIYQAIALPYIGSSVNVVIVVDEDIDVTNWEEIIWALSTRVDPAYDVILTLPLGVYALNPAASARPLVYGPTKATDVAYCGKMGIDATLKKDEPYRSRPQSTPVRPLKEMYEKVLHNWTEYGFKP